jgi:hypothetical protein
MYIDSPLKQEPMMVSTRQLTKTFVRNRLLIATILVLVLLFMNNQEPLFEGSLRAIMNGVILVCGLIMYLVLLVTCYRIRTMPTFAVIIDAQRFHAGKLFLPWNSIAAICPMRMGRTEYVGIYLHDLQAVLRQSRMNSVMRTLYRWLAAYAIWRRGVPPFGIFPDTMDVPTLLHRLWEQYYPEYQRYQIAVVPPVSSRTR